MIGQTEQWTLINAGVSNMHEAPMRYKCGSQISLKLKKDVL